MAVTASDLEKLGATNVRQMLQREEGERYYIATVSSPHVMVSLSKIGMVEQEFPMSLEDACRFHMAAPGN